MFSHTKKEELEFENSDRQLFGSNNTNFENNYLEKLSESELALWPLVPLTNFAKDAYKNDNIYMGKNFGDEAPEEMMSEDNEKKPEGLGKTPFLFINVLMLIDIIYEKANQNNETNGASGQATQTMIPLKTQMTTKESYFLSDHSFSPIELYWEKLTIKASYKQKKRRCPPCCNYEKKTKNILNEVTGIAKPGSFTAILGPSGTFFVNNIFKYYFFFFLDISFLKLNLIRIWKNDFIELFIKQDDERKFILFRGFESEWCIR